MISRRTSFRIRSESSPKTDRLKQVPSSSGLAENPLRSDCWQKSCGTLRTFVGLTDVAIFGCHLKDKGNKVAQRLRPRKGAPEVPLRNLRLSNRLKQIFW